MFCDLYGVNWTLTMFFHDSIIKIEYPCIWKSQKNMYLGEVVWYKNQQQLFSVGQYSMLISSALIQCSHKEMTNIYVAGVFATRFTPHSSPVSLSSRYGSSKGRGRDSKGRWLANHGRRWLKLQLDVILEVNQNKETLLVLVCSWQREGCESYLLQMMLIMLWSYLTEPWQTDVLCEPVQ